LAFIGNHLRLPHSLRRKTLLIILVTMFGLVGGLYTLARVLLLRGYSNLETDFARRDMDEVSTALTDELAALDRSEIDYAAWNQTYLFLKGRNPRYGAVDLPPIAMGQLKLSFVVILDNSGRVVFSRGYNLVTLDEVPVPSDLFDHLKPGSLLLTHENVSDKRSGILVLASGPELVVSRPVVTTNSEGPIVGTMIMGRALDADEILRLSEMTHLSVGVARLDSATLPKDFRDAANELPDSNSTRVKPLGVDFVAAYRELRDVDGRPAIILRVRMQRVIYQQGQTTLLQFLLLLLAAGLTFGAVTLYLLERTVLSRVANMSESITSIGTSGDLSARLAVPGNDELAFLGSAINGMLEDLDRSQIERHEGRTRLGMMIEKVPAILWTTDKDLRFTSSVGAALESLGLRTNQAVGVSLTDFFRTNDPGFPALAAHKKALAGESVAFELEWAKSVFDCHAQPLRSSEGEIIGVIGVALDVTDRKVLADQLRQSQKMQAIGQLAGGVAHDFNNLLMVVKGHAEILLDRLAEASPLRHNVEQVDKATDRAAGLTRQLLAFSRMQVLHARVLDLNEVVGGMIKMFSRVIGADVEMTFLPAPKLGRVKADPGQIEQVLLNLVVNARDAMPNGGRLTIETSNVTLDRDYSVAHHNLEPGSWVMLTVSDTGCGMDEETQARIFEPFFTTKKQGKGTGLGLATVYGVVKQSGGFIYVYSEIDHGTTFKVYLPKVTAEVDREAERTVVAPPRGSETILFVEDEESVRELVRDYLVGTGYQVLEAVDGVQALEVAAAHKGAIQILVTDVVMPRLSGRELASRIAAQRPNTKILFISGYTDDSIFRHGVLEGGVAYLQKPFNLKAIAQKIREVLDGQVASTPLAPAGHK
jgi:PAS domain S-box-containing protein